MKHPDDAIVLQAVEFWSTVCEEEIELGIEAAEVCYVAGLERVDGGADYVFRLQNTEKCQRPSRRTSPRSLFLRSFLCS